MSDELEWARIRGEDQRQSSSGKNGALRIALMFGGAAAALGLIAAPLLDRGNVSNQNFAILDGNIDPFTTASTRPSTNGQKSYTIRRSVLQKNPVAKCIILSNGAATGDC